MQMQHLYAQPYGPVPYELLNLNAGRYLQPRYMPGPMMLDLQQDLAELYGMDPEYDLMQLDELEPLAEAADTDLADLN